MFGTHKLNDNGFAAMKKFKEKMSLAVSEAAHEMPEGREKSIFITKMEEGVFFGAKAIASQTHNHSEIIEYSEYFNEIEKVENGYAVTYWKQEDKEEKEEYGYVEPKKYVATTDEEVLKLIKENL